MKGDSCGFLHQFDQSRMPVCRNLLKTGVCKDVDCPYKHSTEEIKECNMYKLGFCIYGPAVSRRGPVWVRAPMGLEERLWLQQVCLDLMSGAFQCYHSYSYFNAALCNLPPAVPVQAHKTVWAAAESAASGSSQTQGAPQCERRGGPGEQGHQRSWPARPAKGSLAVADKLNKHGGALYRSRAGSGSRRPLPYLIHMIASQTD